MLLYFLIFFGIIIFLVFFSKIIAKKTKYGFFITMGEFGAGKTQNTTGYLKRYKYGQEVNITNYYTGYTHFQIQSHQDLVNILTDIYDYHQYINLYDDSDRLHTHKTQKEFEDYKKNANEFRKKYPNLKKNLKFNIVIDECSIYFNPRDFAINFSKENKKLLDFFYQPRKLNLLMFCVVQSPLELDVKIRRLATYYRKYYKGLGFYRWYKDFYFLNPEEMNLEQAEQVGGGVIFGMNVNFYNNFPILKYISYPLYDYNTKELIRPGVNIYHKGSIYNYISEISQKKPKNKFRKKRIRKTYIEKNIRLLIYVILASFFDFYTTMISIYEYGNIETNPLYAQVIDNPYIFFLLRVAIVPALLYFIFYKHLNYLYIFIFVFLSAAVWNLSQFI